MNERTPRERAALVFLLALVLFLSPLTGWWSALGLPWWAVFVPWAAVIALAARTGGRSGADEPPA